MRLDNLYFFDHGSRLTQEEYQKKITDLYQNLPSSFTKEQELAIRHKELNLSIDYKLGCHFPQERRNALWVIQEKVEKHRFCLTFKYLLRGLFAKKILRDIQGLANFLVEEYAKVLTPEELQQYFDLHLGESPVLPIDLNQLKK